MLDKRTTVCLFQPETEFILSYKANNLNLAAGIAGDKAIAMPTKLASCFLLQYLRCWEAPCASFRAAALNFRTFSAGAKNWRLRRSTLKPKWSNYEAGTKLDFLLLIVSPKHYKIVNNNLTCLFVN